jgi:hypothetical protein
MLSLGVANSLHRPLAPTSVWRHETIKRQLPSYLELCAKLTSRNGVARDVRVAGLPKNVATAESGSVRNPNRLPRTLPELAPRDALM